MTVDFNSGSKWFDNYFEAYYEVIECYYDSLDKQYSGNQYYNYDWSNYYDQNILPSAKQLAASTKGIYSSKYYNDYYEDFYKDYFSENSWDTIWSAYGYGDCDVDKIIKRWGFSSSKDTNKPTKSKNKNNKNLSSSDDSIITAPKKFNKKLAKKYSDFDPLDDSVDIDRDSFGIKGSATFKTAKSKKGIKKLASSTDVDFLYDEKKGGLYFNENGSDKGFGEGGLIAILKGAPDLTSDNIDMT